MNIEKEAWKSRNTLATEVSLSSGDEAPPPPELVDLVSEEQKIRQNVDQHLSERQNRSDLASLVALANEEKRFLAKQLEENRHAYEAYVAQF